MGQAYVLGQEEAKNSTPWLNPQHVGNQRRRRVYSLVNITAYSTTNPTKDPNEEIRWLCPRMRVAPVCVARRRRRTCFSTKTASAYPLLLTNQRKNKLTRNSALQALRIQLPRGNPTHASISRSRRKHCLLRPCTICTAVRKPKETEEDNWFADADASDASRRQHHLLLRTSDKMQHFFAPAMERTYNSIMRRQIIREAVDSLDERKMAAQYRRSFEKWHQSTKPDIRIPLTTTDRPRACMDSRRTFSRRLTQ